MLTARGTIGSTHDVPSPYPLTTLLSIAYKMFQLLLSMLYAESVATAHM